MPTNRRRRTREFRGSVPRLAPWMIEGLLTGHDDGTKGWDRFGFWHGTQGMVPGKCLSIAEAWRHYGPELLSRWIKEHPGSRPAAWWLFDAPESRSEGESETAYLARHELLSPAERRALGTF